MPITVVCECGKRLQANDNLAGKRAKCPTCGRILTIAPSAPSPTPPADANPLFGFPAADPLSVGGAHSQCSICGAAVSPTAAACSTCGTPLRSQPAPQLSRPASAAPKGPAKSSAKAGEQKQFALLIGGGVLALLVLVVVAFGTYWGVSKLRGSMAKAEQENATQALLKDPTNTDLAKRQGSLAVSGLLEALNGQDEAQRLAAVQALGAIGEPAKEAVSPISDLLKSAKDPKLIVACVDALGAMGSAAETAAPEIAAIAQRSEANLVQPALRALVRLGPSAAKTSLPVLMGIFQNSTDETLRRTALEGIAGLGTAGQESLPVLLTELQSQKTPFRPTILSTLPKIAPDDPQVLNALIAGLSRTDTLVLATEGLRSLGTKARTSVPALFDSMSVAKQAVWQRLSELQRRRDDQPVVTERTYNAIGEVVSESTFGGGSDEPLSTEQTELAAILRALPAVADGKLTEVVTAFITGRSADLLSALKSDDELVRVSAIKALAQTDDIPGLIQAVSDPDPQVRRGAAEALAICGSNHPGALTALLTLLQGDDQELRDAVGRQFARNPLILEALGGGSLPGDDAFATALAAALPNLVPAVTQILNDPNPIVRLQGVSAVGKMGPAAKDALPILIRYLDDADPRLRLASAASVLSISSASESEAIDKAIVTLGNLVEEKGETDDRNLAAHHLAQLGARAAPAVPQLAKALSDSDEIVGTAAARALGAIGPEAKPAVPALVALLERIMKQFYAPRTGDVGVSPLPLSTQYLLTDATEALKKIDPTAHAAYVEKISR